MQYQHFVFIVHALQHLPIVLHYHSANYVYPPKNVGGVLELESIILQFSRDLYHDISN